MCEKNMIQDEYSGDCVCIPGYVLNKSKRLCEKCFYYKNYCLI